MSKDIQGSNDISIESSMQAAIEALQVAEGHFRRAAGKAGPGPHGLSLNTLATDAFKLACIARDVQRGSRPAL